MPRRQPTQEAPGPVSLNHNVCSARSLFSIQPPEGWRCIKRITALKNLSILVARSESAPYLPRLVGRDVPSRPIAPTPLPLWLAEWGDFGAGWGNSMRHRLQCWFSCAAFAWLTAAFSPVTAAEYDVMIRHGKIVDGSGNPWFYGDVAIKGDRIVGVGRVKGDAKRIIDADGLV